MQLHVEGIAGERKGQHVKFWIFSTVAVWANLEKSDYPGSQFFILYEDWDTSKSGYAILELHMPGRSQILALEDLDIPLDKVLFSSYPI